MKKLLVTAIGAAAALGASAGWISTQRFENVTGELPQTASISNLNAWAGKSSGVGYWSGDELTNTYTLVSRTEGVYPQDLPFDTTPTKALEVKTTFGSPLTLNAIDGGSTTNIPASGIYFDSLVKFTVCEEEPEQTYDGAKIIMWLQEMYDGDTITGTNIMVRASYVNAGGTCTPTNFVCKPFSLSIDDWHRVTIKTLPNIVNGNDIPGFVIFLNGSAINVQSGGTMASEISANLTEAAEKDGNGNPLGASKVFASLVQGNAAGKSTITSASFDGTGKLTDLVFTDVAPFDAAENWVEPQAEVTIGSTLVPGIKTLAQAVDEVNDPKYAGQAVTFQLKKGMTLDGTLAFASAADVTLDFAGVVLTNNNPLLTAISVAGPGTLTITNSTDAVGGVYCENDSVALAFTAGGLAIYGGAFNGAVTLDTGAEVFGGSFKDDVGVSGYLAEGKKLQENQGTGLYDVVDVPTYTITVAGGEHFTVAVTTNGVAAGGAGAYVVTEGDSVAVTYTADTGYTLSKASDSIASVSADATIAAPVATLQTFKVIFVDGETATTNTVDYGSGVGEIPAFAGRTGYTAAWDNDPTAVVSVTSDLTFTAVYTANTYTVTFYTNSAEYATATYTYGNAGSYSGAPADPSVSGYTFGGWYTDNGTFESAFTFDANVAGDTQVAYAKLTEDAPVAPTIDPASDTAVVPVQEGETAEQAAARVEVGISSDVAAALTTAGVSGSTYQGYFSKTAVKDGDNWNVTAEFTDTVETAVATAAEAVVNGTATTVTVPAGLYYKVTTYTALGGSATVAIPSTLSTGAASSTITKPGTTQGFIKIELDTAPIK